MITLRRIFGVLTLLALAACGGGGVARPAVVPVDTRFR